MYPQPREWSVHRYSKQVARMMSVEPMSSSVRVGSAGLAVQVGSAGDIDLGRERGCDVTRPKQYARRVGHAPQTRVEDAMLAAPDEGEHQVDSLHEQRSARGILAEL
jgi:hypothetical protein